MFPSRRKERRMWIMRCEWSRHGYCEYYSTADEQEERETNWPCDGTDEEMQECGMSRKEEED